MFFQSSFKVLSKSFQSSFSSLSVLVSPFKVFSKFSLWPWLCLSLCNKFLGDVAWHCTLSYSVVRLVMIASLNCSQNSTPFWCKASFCTIKIDNFRIYQLGHRMFCLTNKKTAGFDWPIRKQQVFNGPIRKPHVLFDQSKKQ